MLSLIYEIQTSKNDVGFKQGEPVGAGREKVDDRL
jgi:hypothetical protein